MKSCCCCGEGTMNKFKGCVVCRPCIEKAREEVSRHVGVTMMGMLVKMEGKYNKTFKKILADKRKDSGQR